MLLVCSDYDSYTFEEDGLLNELVNSWYSEHSLSKPPVIDRVSNPELGLLRFKERGDYDMVGGAAHTHAAHTHGARHTILCHATRRVASCLAPARVPA